MKNIILAAATVLALGAASTSAFAESEGPFVTGEQWAAQNGDPTIPATTYYSHSQFQGAPQQGSQVHGSIVPSELGNNGQG